jgi:hypothetical protein
LRSLRERVSRPSNQSRAQKTALGFRVHSGWCAAVAVVESGGKPSVVSRQRMGIADEGIAGARQPYHAAENLKLEDARDLIQRCRDRTSELALGAVGAFCRELERQELTPIAAGVLIASERPLPDLASILRSHALIHTAEGGFFRDAVIEAIRCYPLCVLAIRERGLPDKAAADLGIQLEQVQPLLAGIGRAIGPPWTQDEKLAALAAWIALRS